MRAAAALLLLLGAPAARGLLAGRRHLRIAQRHGDGLNRWDLQGALTDNPPGAYFQLIYPTVAATSLAYCLYDPEYKPDQLAACFNGQIPSEYSGGGHWERVPDLEADPKDGGVHTMIFADHGAKRAILTYRGTCFNKAHAQCLSDACVLGRWHTQGGLSQLFFGGDLENHCASFGAERLDYVGQAGRALDAVQAKLPGYAVLLTGHSLGGFLAMMMALQRPGQVQAFTFSPSPFHSAAGELLKLDAARLEALPGLEDRVAVGDPFDLLVNTVTVPKARLGTLSCVYDDWDDVEPPECKGVNPMLKDYSINFFEFTKVALCKKAAHDWGRYTRLFQMHKPGAVAPLVLPNCSRDFSTLTPKLLDTTNR